MSNSAGSNCAPTSSCAMDNKPIVVRDFKDFSKPRKQLEAPQPTSQ